MACLLRKRNNIWKTHAWAIDTLSKCDTYRHSSSLDLTLKSKIQSMNHIFEILINTFPLFLLSCLSGQWSHEYDSVEVSDPKSTMIAEHWPLPWINMMWSVCTSLTVLTPLWKSSHRPKAQHTGQAALQTLVSHLCTNSCYYCYCGGTENLLIPISISHQGSEPLQSHLKAIDCGFESQAWWASFTASLKNFCCPAVR